MRVVTEPYRGGATVVPSDTAAIAPTRGFMATVTGDIAVTFADGSTATFAAVVAGKTYPVSITKVMATGTTATGIIALY